MPRWYLLAGVSPREVQCLILTFRAKSSRPFPQSSRRARVHRSSDRNKVLPLGLWNTPRYRM